MRVEFNGRKIVKTDHFVCCEDCPLAINGPECLPHMLGFIKNCNTGFKYEDSI